MANNNTAELPPIIQVGDVLMSPDIFTECFCCDLDACHGACCVEGDAGAPVTIDEIAAMEQSLDAVWASLAAGAQTVIDRQGVATTDPEGELVTTIVGGRDCVFTVHEGDCRLCALEKACREGRSQFMKPISCALYPLREKAFAGGLVGLNYNRWAICRPAAEKGRRLGLPLYKFLEGPLTRRFGAQWYAELLAVAGELRRQGLLPNPKAGANDASGKDLG